MGLWTGSGMSGGAAVAAAGAVAVAVAGVIGYQFYKPDPQPASPPAGDVIAAAPVPNAPGATPTTPTVAQTPPAPPAQPEPGAPPAQTPAQTPAETDAAGSPTPATPAPTPGAAPTDPAVDTGEAAQPAPSNVASGTASDAIEPEPQAPTAPAQVATTPPPAEPAPSDPAAVPPVAQDGAPEPAPEPAPEQTPEPTPEPTLPAPIFDLLRVDALGAAIVAGQAQAQSSVEILLDGAPVAEAKADNSGKFVAFFDVDPSDQPRLVALRSSDRMGRQAMSAQSVIIAPFAPVADTAPVAVADAPTPAPAPVEDAPDIDAPAAPPTLLVADEDGVRLLDPGAPDAPGAPVNVIIDTISYDATGEVILQGRGTPENTVRIYVDNALVAQAGIAPTGRWSTPLEGVLAGIYTLRVDELTEGGAVVSRFETPFQREERALIAAAAAAPEDAPAVPATPAPAPSAPVAPTAPDAPPASGDSVSVITVQPGSTLWAIARDLYGEGVMYVRVYEANKAQIRDPNLIYPGQVFDLPTRP